MSQFNYDDDFLKEIDAVLENAAPTSDPVHDDFLLEIDALLASSAPTSDPVQPSEQDPNPEDLTTPQPSSSPPPLLKCPKCDFATQWKSNLRHHGKQHEKEERSCSKCPYKTRLVGKLLYHEATRHERVGNKFQCRACELVAESYKALMQHVSSKHPELHEGREREPRYRKRKSKLDEIHQPSTSNTSAKVAIPRLKRQ